MKQGDIVRLDYEPSFSTGGRKGQSLVVERKDTYWALKDNKGVSWPLPSKAGMETIGDIYSNPELLKKT